MSRRAAREKLCPTPSKIKHYSEAECAQAGQERAQRLKAAHIPCTPLFVYQCACLGWHLTHHRYGRDGRRNVEVGQ